MNKPLSTVAFLASSTRSTGWLAAIVLLTVSGIAQAGAREDLEASMQKFHDAKSWHASMQIRDGKSKDSRPITNELDFNAPDRFRIKMANMAAQYIIGDTMIMTMQGRTMRVPMPKGMLSKYRDPAELQKNRATITVEALGSDSVDGAPARKYRIHNKDQANSDVLIWIGGNSYPLQIRVDDKARGSTVTIHYSRINDPSIRVQAPQ